MSDTPKVALLIETARGYGRQMLRGICWNEAIIITHLSGSRAAFGRTDGDVRFVGNWITIVVGSTSRLENLNGRRQDARALTMPRPVWNVRHEAAF
jgi:hypothetical protein